MPGLGLTPNTLPALPLIPAAAVSLPSGLTGIKPFDERLSGYNLTASSLRHFFTALARQQITAAADGNNPGLPLRIASVGDSITLGSAAHAPLWQKSYAGQLHTALVQSFVDAGWMTPTTGSTIDERTTYTGTWSTDSTRGFWGSCRYATGATNTITFGPATCNGFRVYYIADSAGGTFSISIDGGTPQTVNSNAVSASIQSVLKLVTSSALGPHTLTITAPSSGNATILGIEAVNNAAGGVLTCRIPQSGSVASGLVAGTSATGMLACIAAVAPDLVTLMIGTNDFGSSIPQTNPTTFYGRLATFVDAMLTANASVLIVTPPPPQSAQSGETAYAMQSYYQQMYAVADRYDLPLIDLQHRWGSYVTASAYGLMSDYYHPTDLGQFDIAYAIYQALIGPWSVAATARLGDSNTFTVGDQVVQPQTIPATATLKLGKALGQTTPVLLAGNAQIESDGGISVDSSGATTNQTRFTPAKVSATSSTGSRVPVVAMQAHRDDETAAIHKGFSVTQTADLVQNQTSAGAAKSGVLAGGTLFSDDAAQGVILKDTNAHYWRVTVSTGGVVTTADLGTSRPTV